MTRGWVPAVDLGRGFLCLAAPGKQAHCGESELGTLLCTCLPFVVRADRMFLSVSVP